MLFSKNFDILVEIGELSVLEDKPDICQFWYITSLFRLVKNTSKLRKIAKKIRIFYAKKYTSSKKVHHRRLCGCYQYDLCSQQILLILMIKEEACWRIKVMIMLILNMSQLYQRWRWRYFLNLVSCPTR